MLGCVVCLSWSKWGWNTEEMHSAHVILQISAMILQTLLGVFVAVVVNLVEHFDVA